MPLNKKEKIADQLSITLKVGGKVLKEFYEIISIDTFSQLNKLSWTKIEILDGDPAKNDFELSSKKDFNTGEKVSLSLGFHSDVESVFEGMIVNHRIKISKTSTGQISSRIILFCQHETIKLLTGRKNRNFKSKKDSEAIVSIFNEHSLKNKVSSTSFKNENLIQYAVSDWDFILKRIQMNGLVLIDGNKQIEVEKPKAKSSGTAIVYGKDILTMDLELRASNQTTKVSTSAWDSSSQGLVSGNATEPSMSLKIPTAPKIPAAKVDDLSVDLSSSAPYPKDELKAWSDGVLLDSRMSFVYGELTISGNSKLAPNETVKLEGFGDKFKGDIPISGMRHSVRRGLWTTTLLFGLSSELIKEKNPSLNDMNTVLPSVGGLQIGVVKKLDGDPQNKFRVLVTIPTIKDKEGVWARISNLHATKNAGTFFIPEVGDEVILGFLSEDPRHPVILGSLYSKKNTPASGYKITAANKKKSIITPSLFKIEIDEEKQTLSLETPGKNKLILDDKGKAMHLTDCNNNKVDMTSSGIDLSSAKDIKINAKANVKISGGAKVSIESSGGAVESKGLTITQTAQTKLSLKGSATAELSGGGMTEIKGALVKIN